MNLHLSATAQPVFGRTLPQALPEASSGVSPSHSRLLAGKQSIVKGSGRGGQQQRARMEGVVLNQQEEGEEELGWLLRGQTVPAI